MLKSNTAKVLIAVSVASFIGLLGLNYKLSVAKIKSVPLYGVFHTLTKGSAAPDWSSPASPPDDSGTKSSATSGFSPESNSPEYNDAGAPTKGLAALGFSRESSDSPKGGEAGDRQRRFPKALIVGFAKCGTSALRTFLTIHPDVVSPIPELMFFERNFSKGIDWYRSQMPLSTSKQLTLEKTPGYITSNVSLTHIKQLFPKMKLIAIVRNPIIRLQSQYAHVHRRVPEGERPSFRKWLTDDQVNIGHYASYAYYIRLALKHFPRSQLLVHSEDDFENNPVAVLKATEKFLGLRPVFSKEMFRFNREKGFYCFNPKSEYFPAVLKLVEVSKDTGCMFKDKGREHPPIEPSLQQKLLKIVEPYNEALFKVLNKRFNWSNVVEKADD